MEKESFMFDAKDYRFHSPAIIRFNDIDILGHLNNTVYFSLFDTGKAEYMQTVLNGEVDWQRVESVIGTVNCVFKAPCYYGEKLDIYTKCVEMGQKTFTLLQVLVNSATLEVKAICTTIMVSYDPSTHRSAEVSMRFRTAVEQYENTKFPHQQND